MEVLIYVSLFFVVFFGAYIALEKVYKDNTFSAENTTAEHQKLMKEYNGIISLISLLISVTITLLIYFYFK